MDLQRISIKLYAQPESEVEARDFVPVFHSWIQNQRVANHLLIDVANYAKQQKIPYKCRGTPPPP